MFYLGNGTPQVEGLGEDDLEDLDCRQQLLPKCVRDVVPTFCTLIL